MFSASCFNATKYEHCYDNSSFNADCLMAKMCRCSDDNELAQTVFDMGPYLYPFSIEFSILVGKIARTTYVELWTQ